MGHEAYFLEWANTSSAVLMFSVESQKAVVLSDVHLGYDRFDRQAFLNFLKTYPDWGAVDHFILLGDTFDFWRRQNARILYEDRDIVGSILSLGPKVIFVVGNHDYYLRDIAERFYNRAVLPSREFRIEEALLMKSGGKGFLLTHGYELEVLASSWLEPLGLDAYESFCEAMCKLEDKSGAIASWVWDLLSRFVGMPVSHAKPALKRLLDPAEERINDEELTFIESVAKSNAKNVLLGLSKDDVLVFGHTHRAFKDGDVVNTGSWVTDPKKEFHNWVEITKGTFELNNSKQTPEAVERVRRQMVKVAGATPQTRRVKSAKKSVPRHHKAG